MKLLSVQLKLRCSSELPLVRRRFLSGVIFGNPRRKFLIRAIALLTVPLTAHGQWEKPRRIGVLGGEPGPRWRAFEMVLRQSGWREGDNVQLVWRWSSGTPDRIPELIADLLRLKVDVIVTEGTIETTAAKIATKEIPIVMATTSDPIGTGLVASLARPGGNVTGSATTAPQLLAKQIELLNEAIIGLEQIAVLRNPTNPAHRGAYQQVESGAGRLNIKVRAIDAHDAATLARAYPAIIGLKPQALIILADVVFDARQPEIAAFARTSGIPAIYNKTAFAEAGGLMSYGARYDEFFRQAARYVDRILRGAKPGELPVMLPTQFDLFVNVRTANELAIRIPESVLLRANRVIE
jgi:putative ABC transport system substrate-binding protein